MRKITELSGEIEARRRELAALFDAHRTNDGDYDLTEAECEEVRRRNDELEALVLERERLGETARIEAVNRRALEEDALPRRLPVGGKRAPENRGLGDLFVASNAFRDYRAGRGPAAELDVDLKTLFQTTAGWAPESTRTGRVVPFASQSLRVADIVPRTETGQSAVVYMEETTNTNAATEVAEGAAYPESAFVLTEQTSPVRKISAFVPVTDEQFQDEPRSRDYLNNRLAFQLLQRLDQQLLVGNGSAPNLRGLLNASGIQTQAKGTDPMPDAVMKAMVKVRAVGFAEPTHVVMHPNDWQDLRLVRTTDGIYIWGNPSEAGPERIFGLPVVQTTYETEGTALVGDFSFCELALRRGMEIQVSNSHSDYFTNGKLAVRADIRAAFVIYRGAAFCKVTGA